VVQLADLPEAACPTFPEANAEVVVLAKNVADRKGPIREGARASVDYHVKSDLLGRQAFAAGKNPVRLGLGSDSEDPHWREPTAPRTLARLVELASQGADALPRDPARADVVLQELSNDLRMGVWRQATLDLDDRELLAASRWDDHQIGRPARTTPLERCDRVRLVGGTEVVKPSNDSPDEAAFSHCGPSVDLRA
jgi:hypothetical protein